MYRFLPLVEMTICLFIVISNDSEKSIHVLIKMWNYNFYVYITTNPTKTALYVGVTNDLSRRLFEHEENKGNKSTYAGKYHCHNLIYYEHFTNIEFAIEREKEIKKWSRKKKADLIETINPTWTFLNEEFSDKS